MKKKLFFFIITIMLAGAGGYMYLELNKDVAPEFDFVIVKKANLTESVDVTGKVIPSETIELAFELSGKVSTVYVKVGDYVKAGTRLVSQNSTDLEAQLAEANARVRAEEASLADLLAGTRPEELQVQAVKITNAKKSLVNYKAVLIDVLKDAFTKSDDSVRNKIDQFLNDPVTNNPQLKFSVTDSQLQRTIAQSRVEIENNLKNWQLLLGSLAIHDDLMNHTLIVKSYVNKVITLLENCAIALNSNVSSPLITQATLDSWRANITTARANMNTAVTNITTATDNINNAQSAINLAESELQLLQAGALSEQVKVQEAKLEQAIANTKTINAKLDKTVVIAPISGIITKQDARVGEILSANSIIIELISKSDFEIETNIPEVDIAQVKIGNKAIVTFDAYSSEDLFNAKVVSIDPSEKIIDGVATYRTVLLFDKFDSRIRSGMSVNMEIINNMIEDVISIPARAVRRTDGVSRVTVFKNNLFEEVEVETGLRSRDGKYEIISGITEGDMVVTFIKDQ